MNITSLRWTLLVLDLTGRAGGPIKESISPNFLFLGPPIASKAVLLASSCLQKNFVKFYILKREGEPWYAHLGLYIHSLT